MKYQIRIAIPPKAPPPSSAGSGALGPLQFFCLLADTSIDNAKRVCVWIPGLQPTDTVSWTVGSTFISEAPSYENIDAMGSTDACLIMATTFSGDTGTLIVTATVNGSALPPLTISLPGDCA